MSDASPSGGAGGAPSELSLRIVGGLVRHLGDSLGVEVVEEVLAGTSIAREDVERGGWARLDQLERLLESARRRYPDDASFTQAFGYRLAETLGPMRYLAWAPSPMELFVRSLRSIDTLSTFSHAEATEVGRGRLRVRYWSDRAESRLMCLSRKGQLGALPTVFGLPAAIFEESACIARGDPCCVYDVRVPERSRLVPELLGLLLGAGATLLAARLQAGAVELAALPVLGWLAGHAIAHRRDARAHEKFASQSALAMRNLALEEAEARRGLVELHEGQREWTRHIEAQLAERVAASQRLLARFAAEREEHAVTVRGVSHDLRNPIATLVLLEWQLRRALAGDASSTPLLEDHAAAVDQLDRLVDELLRAVHGTPVPRAADPLEVAPLVEQLRRRLRALVHRRGISVVVSAAEGAPASIEVDSLVFHRVVDHLLTNAAEYTAHGRIEVELSDDAGGLLVRVTDTGRGIAAERIEDIFRARVEPMRHARNAPSPTGLSTVVRLMAEIGGRLEVTSKVGVGTTFWAHFPARPTRLPPPPEDPHGDELVRKIVRFRSDPPEARQRRSE